MGLFRPAKVVRQTGRAAPTNFLGYILLFLVMATGTAAWSKVASGKCPTAPCLLSAAPGGSGQLGTPTGRPATALGAHAIHLQTRLFHRR